MINLNYKLELENVEHAVRALALSGIPKLEDVASLVNTSPRTLQRCLAEQNVTFSELVDEVRQECAKLLLRETDLPIGDVARKLGQTDVSNFGRCFKRWTGRSPARWRKIARKKASQKVH